MPIVYVYGNNIEKKVVKVTCYMWIIRSFCLNIPSFLLVFYYFLSFLKYTAVKLVTLVIALIFFIIMRVNRLGLLICLADYESNGPDF